MHVSVVCACSHTHTLSLSLYTTAVAPTLHQDALHAKLVALIKLGQFTDALSLVEGDRSGALG